MRRLTTLIIVLVLVSACASQRPLSTREQGALTGAALGAGAGALIGSSTGSGGTGAAVGAGLGLLTGALIGGAIENQRGETPYPPPPQGPPQPSVGNQPGPPGGAGTVDPTGGQFVNDTRWRLEVFVDTDPQGLQGASAIVLRPQESHPYNLDLGPHRVIAKAMVDTQFGTRTVGQYDRTIQVDPRSSGWTLRFTETSFR